MNIPIRGIMIPLFAISLVGSQATYGQDNRGRDLAVTCSGCHGTNGRSASGMPNIAGLDQAYIIKQMSDFKSSTRPATVMHQIAKGFNDDQVAALAAYFALQKK